MTENQNAIWEQMLAVLKELSADERKLFSEVLRAENARISEKSPSLRDDLLKIVRQVIA